MPPDAIRAQTPTFGVRQFIAAFFPPVSTPRGCPSDVLLRTSRKSGDKSPHSKGQKLMIPRRRSSKATLHSSIISGVYRQPMSPPSDALPRQGLPGRSR
jgi:hypothetical protein